MTYSFQSGSIVGSAALPNDSRIARHGGALAGQIAAEGGVERADLSGERLTGRACLREPEVGQAGTGNRVGVGTVGVSGRLPVTDDVQNSHAVIPRC